MLFKHRELSLRRRGPRRKLRHTCAAFTSLSPRANSAKRNEATERQICHFRRDDFARGICYFPRRPPLCVAGTHTGLCGTHLTDAELSRVLPAYIWMCRLARDGRRSCTTSDGDDVARRDWKAEEKRCIRVGWKCEYPQGTAVSSRFIVSRRLRCEMKARKKLASPQ